MAKQAARVRDMTAGNPIRLILHFAIPLFIGNIFQQLYNAFDAWCVGYFINDNAMGAVTSSGSLIFLMISFFNGLAMGAGVVIARYFGAKDNDAVSSVPIIFPKSPKNTLFPVELGP